MVKRPIVITCIGYILGIIYGLYLTKISIALILFMLLIAFILKKILNKNAKRYLKVLFPKKAVVILFMFIVIGAIHIVLLDKKYEAIYKIDKNIEITGIIENVEVKEYSIQYVVRVKNIDNKNYINTKFILYTKKNEKKLKYGDYIRLKAQYNKPEISRNYKGFSYENYLKQKGIYGTIQPVRKIEIIEENKINCISKIANNIRNRVIYEANINLSENASAVFLGILLGEKSQISDEINTYFREGNMAHILAVSGAHVSYIIVTLNILLGEFGKKTYFIFTILILTFFMILTNFSPSVVRACIMSIIAIFAKLIHRKNDIYNNLGLSALLILIVNPYTILNIGFELTYLGTIGIVLISQKFSKKQEHKYSRVSLKSILKHKVKRFIFNSLTVSVSVQILIFPIIALNFNTISYNFIISGVISVPLFAIIMIIGIFFLIFVPFRFICFPIIEILINVLIFISKFISKIPFSTIIIPTPNIVWVIAYYLGILAIFVSKNDIIFRMVKSKEKIKSIVRKIIIIILIICIVFHLPKLFKTKDLTIYFIDVGQGDSSLIVTPKNKTILLDGGGSVDDSYDIGKNVLVPYLLDRGITSIDYIIISHFDNDHVRTGYFM